MTSQAALSLARRIERERRASGGRHAYQTDGAVNSDVVNQDNQPAADTSAASPQDNTPIVYAGAPDQVQQQTPVAQTPDRTEQEVKDQPYGAPSLRSRVLGAAGWLMEQPGAGPAYEAAELNNQSRRQAIYNAGDPIAVGHEMHREATEHLAKMNAATPEHDGSYTQTSGAAGAGPGGGAGPSLSMQAARGQPGGYLAPTNPSQSMDQLDAMSARSLRAIYATGDPQYTMAANQQVQAYQNGLMTRQMMQYKLNMLQQGYDQYQRDAAQGPPSQRGVQQQPTPPTPGGAPYGSTPGAVPGGPQAPQTSPSRGVGPQQGAPQQGAAPVQSGPPLTSGVTAPIGYAPHGGQPQRREPNLGEESAKGTLPRQPAVPPAAPPAPAPRRSAGFGAIGYAGARVSNDADWQWAMQRVSQAADLGIPGAKGQLERMQKQWEDFHTPENVPGYGSVDRGIMREARLRSNNPVSILDDIQAEMAGRAPQQREQQGETEAPFTAGGKRLEYTPPKPSDMPVTSPTEKGEAAAVADTQNQLGTIRNAANVARQAQQRALALDDAIKRLKTAGGFEGTGPGAPARMDFLNAINDAARVAGLSEIQPGPAGEAQLAQHFDEITERAFRGLSRRMDPTGRLSGLGNLAMEPSIRDSPYAAELKKAYGEAAIDYAHQWEKSADAFLAMPNNHSQTLQGLQEFMDKQNPPENAIRNALVKMQQERPAGTEPIPIPVRNAEEASRLPAGTGVFMQTGPDAFVYGTTNNNGEIKGAKPVPRDSALQRLGLGLTFLIGKTLSTVIGGKGGEGVNNVYEGFTKGAGATAAVKELAPGLLPALGAGLATGGRAYQRGGRVKTPEQERAEKSALRLAYAATRRAR